jgi:hypothetical protein
MATHLEAVAVDAAVIWLVTLFTFTGLAKLVTYRASVASIGRYEAVLGRATARGIGYAVPWLELAVAAAIVLSGTRTTGGWGAAILGMGFGTTAGLAVRTRQDVGCGCAGGLGRDRVGKLTVARGLLIMAAGVAVATMADRATLATPVVAGLGLAAALPALLLKAQQTRRRAHAVALQAPLPTAAQQP